MYYKTVSLYVLCLPTSSLCDGLKRPRPQPALSWIEVDSPSTVSTPSVQTATAQPHPREEFNPVFGPVERHDAHRVAERYDSTTARFAKNPEWRKKYGLPPPRPPPFRQYATVKEEHADQAFVRVPLKEHHSQGQFNTEDEDNTYDNTKSWEKLLADANWPTEDGPGYVMVREGMNYGPGPERSKNNEKRDDTGTNTAEGAVSTKTTESTDVATTEQAGGPRKWAAARLKEMGEGVCFLINVDIGTPPQRNYLLLDTATVWAWANPVCVGTIDDDFCRSNGRYSPATSNTSKSSAKVFHTTYGAGDVQGEWYTDTLLFDNKYTIPRFPMAVATSSGDLWAGVLGTAFSETAMSLVTGLWATGQIFAAVFSVGIGGHGQNLGEIVIGGVNRWKYAGDLVPVPMSPSFGAQKAANQLWFLWSVHLSAMGIRLDGNMTGYKFVSAEGDYIIDTGSPLSFGTDGIVTALGNAFWAIRTVPDNEILVSCELRKANSTVHFFFNNSTLILNLGVRDFFPHKNESHCYLGMQPASAHNSSYILGATFLRSAYLVFESGIECVWMATYYSCGDGVVTVGQEYGDAQVVTGQCSPE